MYYVIADSGVYHAKKLEELNAKGNWHFQEEEFKTLGISRVVKVTQKDMAYLHDKKLISRIPFERLYKKDTASNFTKFLYVIMLLQVITLVIK